MPYKVKPKHFYRYHGMRLRCYNKKSVGYKHYGARGITICKEWNTFTKFKKWCDETYIDGYTLDRIDNDGPYSPTNCRWASLSEQAKNKRWTEARRLTQLKAVKAIVAKQKAIFGDPHTRQNKLCSRCRIWKPLSSYHKDLNSIDLVKSTCKICVADIDKKRKLNKTKRSVNA